MTWWISILLYLWQNSLRRWTEQPLSLASKLIVSCLLGLLGAVVVIGIKHLGRELDNRLTDRNVLAVIVTEGIPREVATSELASSNADTVRWKELGDEVTVFNQAAAFVETTEGERMAMWGTDNLERLGLVDDFYIMTDRGPEGRLIDFQVNGYWSEATTRRPSPDLNLILQNRSGMIAGTERLGGILGNGYTRTVVFRAHSVDAIEKAHDIVAAFNRLEGRRAFIQSNLQILRELEKVRDIQSQALVWVTLGSSTVLGLVFGSLAWMEFREERYLLALIRSFGVGRLTLFAHAVAENCLLAVSGVLIGFAALRLAVDHLNLATLKMTWLSSVNDLNGPEGKLLLIGAAAGGMLSCLPIGIGLRKPLGLVLK